MLNFEDFSDRYYRVALIARKQDVAKSIEFIVGDAEVAEFDHGVSFVTTVNGYERNIEEYFVPDKHANALCFDPKTMRLIYVAHTMFFETGAEEVVRRVDSGDSDLLIQNAVNNIQPKK